MLGKNKNKLTIPVCSYEEQYFSYDIYRRIEKEIFIDCGAYNGDTFQIFRKNNFSYEKYMLIDPDPIYIKNIAKKQERSNYT